MYTDNGATLKKMILKFVQHIDIIDNQKERGNKRTKHFIKD